MSNDKIFSRRMVRDKAKAEQDCRNGKGGGNPKLKSSVNGGVNPQDKAHIPEARDQKLEKKDYPPDGGSKYVFEDGIIRLNQRDFDNWTQAYSHLELRAELLSLSKWAESEGKNWFHAVKGALAKRNREVKERLERPAPKPNEPKWLDGIEGVL